MEKCCIFNQPAESFKENKDFEVVKSYGEYVAPNDCRRSLLKCKKCGALFLYQFLEWDAMGEDHYYDNYIQVASEEEADKLNEELKPLSFAVSTNPMIKYDQKAIYSIPNE